MSTCSSYKTLDLTPFSPNYLKKSSNSLSQKNISLIKSLTKYLLQEIEYNELNHHFSKKDDFYSEKKRFRSIESFISKLVYELEIETSTLILSYISMKKFISKSKNYLSMKNFEKIFLTSCYINSKINEDITYDIEEYAKVFELAKDELINLEKIFCERIDYKFFVDEDLFEEYCNFFNEGKNN